MSLRKVPVRRLLADEIDGLQPDPQWADEYAWIFQPLEMPNDLVQTEPRDVRHG